MYTNTIFICQNNKKKPYVIHLRHQRLFLLLIYVFTILDENNCVEIPRRISELITVE